MRERRGQRRDAPSLSPHDKWSCSQNEGVRCNPKQTAAASCVCVSLSLCPVNKLEGLPEESARAYQLIPHTGPHHCTWGARMKLCVCVCVRKKLSPIDSTQGFILPKHSLWSLWGVRLILDTLICTWHGGAPDTCHSFSVWTLCLQLKVSRDLTGARMIWQVGGALRYVVNW